MKVKGISRALRELGKAQKVVDEEMPQMQQGVVRAALTMVVAGSPQFSGNLASNWRVVVDGRGRGYKQVLNYTKNWRDVPPSSRYIRGDDPAVAMTLMREIPNIQSIQLKSKVSIVNSTSYAAELEDAPTTFFRPENLFNGQVMMKGYVVTQFHSMPVKAFIKSAGGVL